MNKAIQYILILLVLVVPLALAGCGGGSSGGSSSSSGSGDNGQTENGGDGQDGNGENGNGNGNGGNGDNGDGDNGDLPEGLSGPLDPIQTLTAFLLEDILADGIIRDLDTGTGVEDDLADGTVCISQGLAALVDAPDTLIAAFLGDFQHQQNVADLDEAAVDAGRQLDVATNRFLDGLLLALGGSGTCGGMVAAPEDLDDIGLESLDDLIAFARGGVFEDVTTVNALQDVLTELSDLTADLRNELAGNEELASIYRNLVAVVDDTVFNTIDVVNAISNSADSFDQVLTETGILVEDLLDGLLTVLGLDDELGDLDGILDLDGLLALEEVEAIITGIVAAVQSGDPEQILDTLTASLEGVVEGLLGGDALDLLDAGLLDDILEGGGPLGEVLEDLLGADTNLIADLLGLVDGILGGLIDDLLGGLLGN